MNLINLTAHEINIFDADRQHVATVAPSGIVARCAVGRQLHRTLDNGVPIYVPTLGSVENLPAHDADTLLITSLVVKNAASRSDVVSPGELLRNAAGQPIGCIGLDW